MANEPLTWFQRITEEKSCFEVPCTCMNMKKTIIVTIIACVLLFVNVSCHKDADYVLHVGEGFTISLVENSSANMVWEWENSDKTDVVSMIRGGGTPILSIGDAIAINDSINLPIGYGSASDFYFRAEKKGYTIVKMVYAKDNPDYQKTINFSICVID